MTIRVQRVRQCLLFSAAGVLGAAPHAAGQAPGTVFRSAEIVIPDTTSEVVRGDLDGDGRDDLFVGTRGNVSFVLLSDGQGNFATQPVSSGLGEALRARLGDLDNDGDLDVVVSGLGSSQSMAALGNGDGSFGAAYVIANIGPWLQFELGDLNSDGRLDLAGGSRVNGKVGLWLGTGGGSMIAGTATPTIHSAPFEARLHDVDGDSDLDLVLGGSFGVRWFANDHQGTLGPGFDLVAAPGTHITEFLDLDGDAKDDLVVASPVAGYLNVHLAVGAGSFGPPVSFAQGLGVGGPTDGVHGDLDADGRPDLAVLSSYGSSVSTLRSNGIGGFGPPMNQAVEVETFDQDVEMLDADGDGDLDLAAADGRITLLFNDGSGVFGKLIPAGDEPAGLASADFDHDGHVDLVVSNSFSHDVSVFRGDGAGSFQPLASPALSAAGGAIESGDVSGDGFPDLAVALPSSNAIAVLLGNGAGAFGPSATLPTGSNPRAIAIGDVTGDLLDDIVVACAGSDEIRVHRALGGGAFAPGLALPAGDGPHDVVIVDLTGDGVKDIAVANLDSDSLTLVRSSGTGAFAAFQHTAGGVTPSSLAAGDVNGDGRVDLVTANPFQSAIAVFLGQPTGAFGSPVTFPADDWIAHVALADVDRDGHLDVVCARGLHPFEAMGNGVLVLRGDGSGALAAPSLHAGGIDPTALVVADFDEDGRPDAAVASYNGVAVLENILPDCGPIATFGASCAGTLASAPDLAMDGCAAAGATVVLRVTGGPGPSTAMLFLGTGQSALAIPFACQLLVAPLLPVSFALPLSSAGELSFGASLPATAAGAQLTLQAFVVDPALAGGFGATNGVSLSVTGP